MYLFYTVYVIVHGLTAIITLLLSVYYFYLHWKKDLSLVLLMGSLNLFYSITNFSLIIIELLSTDLRQSNYFMGVKLMDGWILMDVFGVSSTFFIGLVLIFGIYFYDGFKGYYSVKRIFIASFGLGGLVILFIQSLFSTPRIFAEYNYIENTVIIIWSPIIWIILGILSIVAGVVGTKDLFNVLRRASNKTQQKQIKFMIWGTILGFIVGPILSALGDNVTTYTGNAIAGAWTAEIFGYGTISLGLVLAAISYLSGKEKAFLQPYKIDSLLVILDSGLLGYEYIFAKTDDDSRTILLSGALTAIRSLMDETLGNVEIELIKMNKFDLMIKLIPNAAVVLIAEKRTRYLQNALNNFTTKLIKNVCPLVDDKNKMIINVEIVNKYVENSFGISS